MDYKTKPISRDEIRKISLSVRNDIFKCKNKYYFDVIKALEILPQKFKRVSFEIVSDNDKELNGVPAITVPDMKGNYCIKIKESVYEGAYYKKTGGYRGHIMHEISHVILFILSYVPNLDVAYGNRGIKPYESIEWQTKALAGEILMPYEATKGMDYKTIMKRCKVSEEAARNRVRIKWGNRQWKCLLYMPIKKECIVGSNTFFVKISVIIQHLHWYYSIDFNHWQEKIFRVMIPEVYGGKKSMLLISLYYGGIYHASL